MRKQSGLSSMECEDTPMRSDKDVPPVLETHFFQCLFKVNRVSGIASASRRVALRRGCVRDHLFHSLQRDCW